MHRRHLPCLTPCSRVQSRESSAGMIGSRPSTLGSRRLCCFRFLEPFVEFFPLGAELGGYTASRHFERHFGWQVVGESDDDRRDYFEERAFLNSERFHASGQWSGETV